MMARDDESHPSLRIASAFHARTGDLEAIADLDGRLTWVSPGWEAVLGWTPDEMCSRPYIEFVHPDDLSLTRSQGASFSSENTELDFFENRYRTRKGDYRWLQWNAIRKGEEIFCRARDVTERKRMQLAALDRLHWLEMIDGFGDVGYWHVDLRTFACDFSPQVLRIHGRDPSTPMPSMLEAFNDYHPEDQELVKQSVARAVQEKRDWTFEARMFRPNGEVRLVQQGGRCDLNEGGMVVGLYGVLRDITEQRRMEESMRQTERMASLGTLSSAIAHEINNPLTYILANIDFLTGELANVATRDQFEMLVEARRGAEQVRKIVSGLKAFSRMGSTVREAVDVAETVDIALRMVGNELRHKARVETDIDEVPPVSGDTSELLQVLTNVFVNAAQAIPDDDARHHRIQISVHSSGAWVEIMCTDTGVGLPDDSAGRIFEPFFTTKPQGVGTGLGLSVSLGIIQRMGGTLDLTGAPAGGARAVIRLPIAAATDFSSGHEEEDSVRPIRSRVLIIDDDERVSRAMKRMLSRHYDVDTFDDGHAALERIRHDAPDVILCDLMMPGFSGIQFYEEASRIAPEVIERLIFITGGAFGAEARGFLEGIRNPVLEKPVDVTTLHALIRERVEDRAVVTEATRTEA
ncbi:MAG: PAS domain-containing protein [Myxococcota bacterium]